MLVESFSKKILESKIFDTYVAAVFFATLIFFVLNINNYTPFEMIFWIMIVTVGFKGIANIMFSLTIALVDIDNAEESVEFEHESNKLESLVNDLAIQEATVKTNKNKI
ncbi:MAG: hypothetical protein U9Q04_00245 [Campylobacterota bacterium]|nr:hypothetical protein [Campylobacterota bacterium]